MGDLGGIDAQGWKFTRRIELRSLALKANEADERGEERHLVWIRGRWRH